jgi:hypothetical protein
MSERTLAEMVLGLTYKDMVKFAGAMKGNGYESAESHREKLLLWAEEVVKGTPAQTPTPDPLEEAPSPRPEAA